jgi:hypothetical protein
MGFFANSIKSQAPTGGLAERRDLLFYRNVEALADMSYLDKQKT